MEGKEFRVLSVQSHVVSGYVGNKSATFPLQLHGFDVDAINSVHFSNHTGYGYWKGHILDQNALEEIMDGLRHNGLDDYTHVLSGYIRDSGFLKSLGETVRSLKKIHPTLSFVCSPVMGDNKRMYVPEDIPPVYRNVILPLADIITANQFEIEVLSERTIHSVRDAVDAIDIIHEMGVEIVVLTSTDFGSENKLVSIASRKKGDKKDVLKIEVPRLPTSFIGTGDLFAALFLAWFAKTGDLQMTLERVTGTMQAVLKRTFQTARQKCGVDNLTLASLELRIIQSKQDILNPTCIVAAEPVET